MQGLNKNDDSRWTSH